VSALAMGARSIAAPIAAAPNAGAMNLIDVFMTFLLFAGWPWLAIYNHGSSAGRSRHRYQPFWQ
jgi:hypothetical protein